MSTVTPKRRRVVVVHFKNEVKRFEDATAYVQDGALIINQDCSSHLIPEWRYMYPADSWISVKEAWEGEVMKSHA